MARSLRTKTTRTIALVSDTIASDPYAGRAIHGALAAAVAHGHLLFIGETEGDPVVEEKLIADFLDRQVDAFLTPACSPGMCGCRRCCGTGGWCC
jgi:LacI family transcriptional regulator